MKDFAALLEKLILTPSRNRKIEALAAYFKSTAGFDRGYALAAMTRDLTFKHLKASTLKTLTMERVDPVLFKLSYDYIGDLAETIALIWPENNDTQKKKLPTLTEFIEIINNTPKKALPQKISTFLDSATPNERWAIIKLATGGLRIGISARLAKTALAKYSGQDIAEIEKIWHGLQIPYSSLFAWLDGLEDKPVIDHTETFHPMMLAHPIDEKKDFETLKPTDYVAEWKWDGIRVQLVFDGVKRRIFSRTGDNISDAFPDILEHLNGMAVLDGELLVGHNFEPMPFNALQQRLNRKNASKKHLDELPAYINIYDMLFDGKNDIRHKPLEQRKEILKSWHRNNPSERLTLSEPLAFKTWKDLEKIRINGAEEKGHEGVMIKHKNSPYLNGRPKGHWFKWKRHPREVDTILMYAQRGHGKRSSFYSDYTFGVWNGNEIIPIGKAYSGFTDQELKMLDKWIRNNTIARFGPVREVKKEIVLEIAFDSAHESPRHKSGVAMRFPRISRIRWDKSTQDVETLDSFKKLFLKATAL